MFYLHLSNKTENLLQQLTAVLDLVKNRDPFHPEFFLIQSQGMERLLSQHLSRHFVSWCNYEYLLPTRFFARIAESLGLEDGPADYSREKLSWRLEEILRSVAGKDFSALHTYLGGDGSEMKRYQLAGQLAYVFDQYQIMRLAMVDGWEQERLSSTKNRDAERYQMKLWNMLRESIGHSRHRGAFLRELITLLHEKKDCSSLLPERLSIFGLHSMPPLFLACLEALSLHCDVHFYLLSPCSGYWADQLSDKSALRRGDTVSYGHPLLKSLGQQGREFQNMLHDVDIYKEYASFEDPAADLQQPNLLQKIQSDLLRGEVVSVAGKTAADDSLSIVSAHSPHRELMILRDRILYWLDGDRNLELKDIVVMAPDIQTYSALIPALFHDIPHSIADRNPAFSNTYIAAFLQFLKLCGGRFGWEELLELLERQEIYPHFEIAEDDLEMIRHWVLSSGIRWGLSAEHKRKMGFPGGKECTWEAGLERLFMGYAVNTDDPVCGIIPFADIEGGMAAPLGGLSFFCDVLRKAQQDFTVDRSLAEWSELLLGYVTQLFATGGESTDKLAELCLIIAEMGQEYGELHSSAVSFNVINAWIENAAEEKKSSSGFLRGQLTFCSMLPMRSIPFKNVCLLGINDTVFPKNDMHPPFDLLGDSFLEGDRSRRSDDRYQFLESILSARANLYISYVGQSIRNNDEIPPSVVVSELVELTEFYGCVDVIEKHPLHGFSEKYFLEDSRFFSYSRELLGVAAAMKESAVSNQPWWQEAVMQESPEEVTVEELFSFYAHPQKYFMRKVLGLYPEYNADQHEEHEPFVIDGLQSYLIDQDLLQSKEPQRFLKKMQAAGRWPLAAPGELQFSRKAKEQEQFRNLLQEYNSIAACDDVFIDIEISGVRISGMLSGLRSDGSLLYRYAALKGKDILAAWLQHCLIAVALAAPMPTRLLSKESELIFPSETGGRETLEQLLLYYLEGIRSPSRLLSEPLLAYAKQQQKTEKSGRGDPAGKAIQSYLYSMKEGYEPEWEILHNGYDVHEILGTEFQEICSWFYSTVWQQAVIRPLV